MNLQCERNSHLVEISKSLGVAGMRYELRHELSHSMRCLCGRGPWDPSSCSCLGPSRVEMRYAQCKNKTQQHLLVYSDGLHMRVDLKRCHSLRAEFLATVPLFPFILMGLELLGVLAMNSSGCHFRHVRRHIPKRSLLIRTLLGLWWWETRAQAWTVSAEELNFGVANGQVFQLKCSSVAMTFYKCRRH